MTQGLKRKRNDRSAPRKAARVDEDNNAENFQDTDMLGVSDEDEVGPNGEKDDGGDDGGDENGAEWNGIGDGLGPQPSTDQRPEGSKPQKPPTGEELRAIKDASDLFKSSSFKLQIDALLPNVRPKPSRVLPLEKFLFVLHGLLRDLPSVAPSHPLEASRRLQKNGIAVPYALPLPTEDTNWKVAFEPPLDIALVGSWANKVSVKSKDDQKFGVDIAIEMPDCLFQEKDYLNGRFFHKRAFYLATIAAGFLKSGLLKVDMSYESSGGDPRLSKLVITPKKNGSAEDFSKLNAKVCVIPTLSRNSVIPLHRLSPSSSNLKISKISDDVALEDTSNQSNPPTPHYNNALLKCLTPKSHLLTNHNLQAECAAYSDALTLLRVWASQRGYCGGPRSCVRGFESAGPLWASVLVLLLNGEEQSPGARKATKRRVVGKGLSSYQLFKAALEFFAKHDFEKDAVFIKSPEGRRYSSESYQIGSQGVLVDASSLINLLDSVPLSSLDLLRHEAAKTLEILNQPTFSGDPFTTTFLTDVRSLPTRFDALLRVKIINGKARDAPAHSTIDAGSPTSFLINAIASILRRGLGNRSRAVTILHPSSTSRPLSQAHPSTPEFIFIGLVHNPQEAFRLVDQGPAADEQDESIFRTFRELWGDKAELRRFKDGRIVESVVWEVTTADEKVHIPSMVVRHLLERHFGLGEDSVHTWDSSFDCVLRLPPTIAKEYREFGCGIGFKGALNAFDTLVKSIKGLDEELPLSLVTVSPISESLRYSNVLAPVPLPAALASVLPATARYLAPINIVMEFEKSSRWPDNLKAVQTLKLAFFERIASALMESVEGLTARVVTGDGINESLVLDKSFLEIITPDGWAFHAHIWHDREVKLLDKIIQGDSSRLPHVVRKKMEQKTLEINEAIEAKAVWMRRFIHAPRHHRAIAALCHHYSAFPGTVRLVKRWLASHWLLGGHISEEVIELICASLFVVGGKGITSDMDVEQTSQHLVPGSKERGFAMVVQFFKDWKWEEGLFVPLYGLVEEDGGSNKQVGHVGVWKVSTELDRDGQVWMYKGPDLVVANRVRALATATWNLLQGMENGQLNAQSLFVHPTDDYDFIIDLDTSALTRYAQNVNADTDQFARRRYANEMLIDKSVVVMPAFDPAQALFDDLQRIYADTFKVFYDPFGGAQFGCVWDPSLREARPFRVLGGFSSTPVKRESHKSKDKCSVTLN